MKSYFKLLAAGPVFFLSAWLLMVFAGIVATDVGLRPFGYLTAMVVTIGLWLCIAPAAGAVSGKGRRGKEGRAGPDRCLGGDRGAEHGAGRQPKVAA